MGKTYSNRSNTSKTKSSRESFGKGGRPKPMTPKAGFTKHRSRYEEGGNWCW